jgi:hypothetical protein
MQATSALLFLYREVLERPLNGIRIDLRGPGTDAVAGLSDQGSLREAAPRAQFLLPAERTLFAADLEDSPDLAANIRRLGLRVDTFVGLHSPPMPWPPR